jgi:uncharacterized protein YgiM (DUF1202 family)
MGVTKIGWGVLVVIMLMAACQPTNEPARVIEVTSPGSMGAVVVTSTPRAALIPTLTRAVPTDTPAPATETPSPTATTDVGAQQLACETKLESIYIEAANVCLGKPGGFFCNGGGAPQVAPSGALQSALALPGSLVETGEVDQLLVPPMSGDAGGLLWMRLTGFIEMNALLVGNVRVRDITLDGFNLPAWQSIEVVTAPGSAGCATMPVSTFLMQSQYGQTTRIGINGISIDLNGTVAVQTHGEMTSFISLEGISTLVWQSNPIALRAGDQMDVTYKANDYSLPQSMPLQPSPLEEEMVEHLPVVLLDRPIPIPQPGFIITTENVNMRAEPVQESFLIYTVPANTTGTILGRNAEGDWLHVRLGNGETGWMKRDLLNGDFTDVTRIYEATPLPPQRPGDLGSYGTVIAQQGANLRRAPDVSFPVLMSIPAGTKVQLIGRSPYSPWVKIKADLAEGWMALINIETQAVIGSLPVDYQVPLPPRATSTPSFSFGGGHAYPDPNGGS